MSGLPVAVGATVGEGTGVGSGALTTGGVARFDRSRKNAAVPPPIMSTTSTRAPTTKIALLFGLGGIVTTPGGRLSTTGAAVPGKLLLLTVPVLTPCCT